MEKLKAVDLLMELLEKSWRTSRCQCKFYNVLDDCVGERKKKEMRDAARNRLESVLRDGTGSCGSVPYREM